MYPTLQLKAGKEANVAFRHPWVYSGAIETKPDDLEHGALVHVADRKGEIIGTGTYSNASSIAVRVFDFQSTVIDKPWLKEKIAAADARRQLMGYGRQTHTTGYRVVFGEADQIPGLIIDRYDDVLVIQAATAGIDNLKPLIVEALVEIFAPRAIVERSDINVRREEKLPEAHGVLYGKISEPVVFKEHGLSFIADVLNGQKTGFFLDQKDLRQTIARLCSDRHKNVLNLFSYSAATGVIVKLAGAEHVHNVDGSEEALALAKQHADLNNVEMTYELEDIFQWLNDHDKPAYDLVLIDPPAIIKSAKDAANGKKAYHFLNRAAMRLVKEGGLLVTSSCSHFMSEDDLAFTLRRASVQAGVTIDLLNVIGQSPDHPQSIYFPESKYLKSFVCQVKRESTK